MKDKAYSETTAVIVNDGLGPNLGDQAILSAIRTGLNKAYPGLDLKVFPNSDMRSIKDYRAFWLALKKSRLMIFGGGQVIQDQTSLVFLLSGLFKIIMAKMLSKPVICYAVGAGPVRTKLGRWLVPAVLNRVHLITVRDEDSLDLLKTLKVTTPPYAVTADPAFRLVPVEDIKVEKLCVKEGISMNEGMNIAVTPRRWFHYDHHLLPAYIRRKFFPLKGETDYENLKQTMASVCDTLVSDHRAQVIFIPMKKAGLRIDPGQDDDRTCAEIISRMRYQKNARILLGDYSPEEMMALLGKMDLIMGMRMHSLIMGAMMGIPVIGLSISPKFRSFFSLIGLEEFVIDINEVDASLLLRVIKRAIARKEKIPAEMKPGLTLLKERASENVSYIQEFLS